MASKKDQHTEDPPRGALDRALRLVELLASDLPSASLSELARATGLSMSTASRLLGTLIQAGLVERSEARNYTLGPRLVELGRRAAEAHAVTSLSDLRPVRDDSAAVLGRELADERADLLDLLGSLESEGRIGSAERSQRLVEIAATEQAWYDCAKIIAVTPGATVGFRPEPVEALPGRSVQPGHQVVDATHEVERVRAQTLRLLDGLDADALSRVGTHRVHGPVSVLQCLRAIARADHDLISILTGKPVSRREPRPQGGLPSVTHDRRVLLHHVNMRGIVTTVAMLIYLEEAEAALLRSLDLLEYAHRFTRIYFEVQHRRPSYYDDMITVHLMVNRVGETSVHYDFTIFNEGSVVAFGKWGLCLMGDDGQPMAIPPVPRKALEEPAAVSQVVISEQPA
jgi:acyl-CoA thioesterase FadM/DNA-binding MarR family transcriptional regulator